MNFGADDNTGLPQDSGTLRGFAVVNELRRAYPNGKKQKWPWVVIAFCLLLLGTFLIGIPLYLEWKEANDPPPRPPAQTGQVAVQTVDFLELSIE